MIERDNIILDGANYTIVEGPSLTSCVGILLDGRHNVTIKNVIITGNHNQGISINNSSDIRIYKSNVTDNNSPPPPYNSMGIVVSSSSWVTIDGNIVVGNTLGIILSSSLFSNISSNIIVAYGVRTMSTRGLTLDQSNNIFISNNTIVGGATSIAGQTSNSLISANSISGNQARLACSPTILSVSTRCQEA